MTTDKNEGDLLEKGQNEPKEGEVVPYDFISPSSIPSEHKNTMTLVHESYAQGVVMILSSFLRHDVQVEVSQVEQMSYSQFIASIVNPSCLATFDMHPLSGFGVLDISPALVFLVVNRMAGGKIEPLDKSRNFTDLEMAITRRFLKMLLKELSFSWEYLLRIQFNLQETQTNPAFIRITSPSEPCIIVSFTVKIGTTSGLYTLCFPYSNLEPLAEKLSNEQSDRYGQRQTENILKAHMRNFNTVQLELSAVLGEIELTFTELLALQEGDILDLGKRTRDPILVRVGGTNKYLAKPGLIGRYKGVSIDKEIFNREEK